MGEWEDYQTAIRTTHRRRIDPRQTVSDKTPFKLRKFAPCDGEGVTRENGRHEYVLLRMGDRELFKADGRGLTSYECLEFIAGQDPDRIYIGYYFDYDVTKILQGLPAERLERIVRRELRPNPHQPGASLPVDWGPFRIDYMKGKEFRVQKEGGPWVTISDCGPFFQCSFVKALTAWFGGESELYDRAIAKIKEGKDQRATFGGLDEYMRKYCKLECDMLTLLMNRFRSVCYELNLHPPQWQGPGRVASAVLKREKYPSSKSTPLWESPRGEDIAKLANAAYYGGRFEAAIIGEVPGPIYQYDINSAYPAVYRTLPCLKHGLWIEFLNRLPTDGSLYVADIEFQHSHDIQYCGLPVRSNTGTLLFPFRGRGIYWSTEIEKSLPYLTGFTVHRGYKYIPQCDCNPFSWVEPMYLERKKLGKSGKGIVLKLALNSIYGKLCQSIGNPTYANPIHASLITATTRGQLYEAMMLKDRGHDVIMAATDGIFCTSSRAVDCGTNLGQWEETIHKDIFVVQSGVYYIAGQTPKTRGTAVSRLVTHEAEFRAAWRGYLPSVRKWKTIADQRIESVSVPVNNFISLPLALAWRKPDIAGQWIDDTRDIAFEWFTKRTVFSGNRAITRGSGTYLITRPHNGGAESIPYKKAIGGVLDRIRGDARIEHEWLADTQPDWNLNGDISGENLI